jgi:hypothetical protein
MKLLRYIDDLDGVMVGDKIIVCSYSYVGMTYRLQTIVRVTKTQFKDDAYVRYSKSTGDAIGISETYAIFYTEERWAEAQAHNQEKQNEREKRKLCHDLSAYTWHELSLEDLRAIKAMLTSD